MEVIEPNMDLSKRKDIDKVKRDVDKIIENAWKVHCDTYSY